MYVLGYPSLFGRDTVIHFVVKPEITISRNLPLENNRKISAPFPFPCPIHRRCLYIFVCPFLTSSITELNVCSRPWCIFSLVKVVYSNNPSPGQLLPQSNIRPCTTTHRQQQINFNPSNGSSRIPSYIEDDITWSSAPNIHTSSML
jgi:hypothetical protein